MGRERGDWVALHLATGLGDRKKRRLVERFGSPGDVLRRTPEEIVREAPCGTATARKFLEGYREVERVLPRLEASGATTICWDDESYPPLLKESYDPPLVFFLKGDPAVLRMPAVGIVGARRAVSGAGAWTEDMAAILARSGFLVVSGMAVGIAGAAHRGALRCGGRTAAVLGTGFGVDYPFPHLSLKEEVARSGALITEFPPGTEPKGEHFPRRNRILAGLCDAVVVIQAAEKSGAMITARYALESNRELFVLAASPWDRRFAGNRRLARQGAPVVQDGEEVALRLGVTPPAAGEEKPDLDRLGGREREVALLLEERPMSADEIGRETGRPPADVLPLLLEMEMEGVVEERAGKIFALAGTG